MYPWMYPEIRDHRLTPRQVVMLRAAAVMVAFLAGFYVYILIHRGLSPHGRGGLIVTCMAAVLAVALWRGQWQATMILVFLACATMMIGGMTLWKDLTTGQWPDAALAAVICCSCAVYIHEFGYLCRKRAAPGWERYFWDRDV